MKKVILIAMVLFTAHSAMAEKQNVDAFVVSRNVHDYQCTAKGLKYYSFEETFRNLFSHEYLNSDLKKLRPLFSMVDQQLKETCATKGYFQFDVQECYHKCHDQFNVRAKFSTLCLATCSSIHSRAINLHEHAYEIKKIESSK